MIALTECMVLRASSNRKKVLYNLLACDAECREIRRTVVLACVDIQLQNEFKLQPMMIKKDINCSAWNECLSALNWTIEERNKLEGTYIA